VAFVAETAQLILNTMHLQGIDSELFKPAFDTTQVPAEKAVNFGYKEMLFKAFQADLPEAITVKGPRDPLADFNLAVGAKIVEVTNQRFARAENLLAEYLPTFDPTLFGQQGKIMDSWETVRHNPRSCDQLILKLKKPAAIHFVSISTQFHFGNHAEYIQIEGRPADSETWRVLVTKTALDGHSLKNILSSDVQSKIAFVRVSLFPDGGLSRLGLYGAELPANEVKKFASAEKAPSVKFAGDIPQVKKPLTPHYSATASEIGTNLNACSGREIDFASAAFGAKILSASNEHYGPAAQVISPFPPLNMFDGFESARSRDTNHFEEIRIQLAKATRLTRGVIDFTFFPNNNPREMRIEGKAGGRSITLLPRTAVKAFAGNQFEFKITSAEKIEEVVITVYPDGGMNRVHFFGLNA
jgi:allantoicase